MLVSLWKCQELGLCADKLHAELSVMVCLLYTAADVLINYICFDV